MENNKGKPISINWRNVIVGFCFVIWGIALGIFITMTRVNQTLESLNIKLEIKLF